MSAAIAWVGVSVCLLIAVLAGSVITESISGNGAAAVTAWAAALVGLGFLRMTEEP